MSTLIADFCRFCWRRTSERALIMIIGFAQYLDDRDLREMIAYLKAVKENRET
jgi:hypothetical protein